MSSRLRIWRRRWYWLKPSSIGWCSLGLMFGTTLIVSCVHWNFENVVRLWGLFLQCVGMGTVLFDLLDRGKSYQRSNPMDWFVGWLKRWPREGDSLDLSMEVKMDLTGTADLRIGLRTASASATVEERLSVIEMNLARLDEKAEDTRQRLQKQASALENRLREERDTRSAQDLAITAKLEKSMVGSLHVSWFGVVWLFVGAVLSTASQEIDVLMRMIR